MPASVDAYSGCSFGTTLGSPDAPSAQIGTDVGLVHLGRPTIDPRPHVRRPGLLRQIQRADEHADGLGRQRRFEPSDGQSEILSDARIAPFASSNVLTSAIARLLSLRTFGSSINCDNWYGGRPLPREAAAANLDEVILRRPVVGQQRTKSEIDSDRDAQRRRTGSERTERPGRARRPEGFESRVRARLVFPWNGKTVCHQTVEMAAIFIIRIALTVKRAVISNGATQRPGTRLAS